MNKEPKSNSTNTWLDPKHPQTRNGQLWPPHPYYYVSGSARATRMTIEASSYQTTPSCSAPPSPQPEPSDRADDEPAEKADDLVDRWSQETTTESKAPQRQESDTTSKNSACNQKCGEVEDDKENLGWNVKIGAEDGLKRKDMDLPSLIEPSLGKGGVKRLVGKNK